MVDVDVGNEEYYEIEEEDDDGEEEMSSSEGEEGEEQEESGGDGEEEAEEVSGWADSIAKILKSNKPKNKKELILSRARKDYEVNKSGPVDKRKKPQDTLEIIPSTSGKLNNVEDGADDAVQDKGDKSLSKKEENILSLKVQRKLELKQKKLELAWENLARLNADKIDPTMERDLLKIATKGVVQLFNAISMQQKTIKTRLRTSKKSEFAKDKILNQTKDIFDKAMDKSKHLNTKELDIQIKEESDTDEEVEPTASITIMKRKSNTNLNSSRPVLKKPVWNALQDNFMLNAKLKDWDQQGSDSD